MSYGFTMPVVGRKTSGFGFRNQPTRGASTFHNGIDIAAPSGTPVVSALGGVVQTVGHSNVRGNFVVVNHGNGLTTKYQHLSRINVAQGNRVTEGQRIGNVGNTGVSTGPHLHFEMALNGRNFNPFDFNNVIRGGGSSGTAGKSNMEKYLTNSKGSGGGGQMFGNFDSNKLINFVRDNWILLSVALVGVAIFKR